MKKKLTKDHVLAAGIITLFVVLLLYGAKTVIESNQQTNEEIRKVTLWRY